MKQGLYRKDFCFMLARTVIFASIAAVLATQVPSFFGSASQQPSDAPSANYVSTDTSRPVAQTPANGGNTTACRRMLKDTIPAASRSTVSRCRG